MKRFPRNTQLQMAPRASFPRSTGLRCDMTFAPVSFPEEAKQGPVPLCGSCRPAPAPTKTR